MSECENQAVCAFYKKYNEDEVNKLTLSMLLNKYCHTENQTKCRRKLVNITLGGMDNVPSNMMPNGMPLPKTDDSSWTEDVKNAINSQLWQKKTESN
ncbi:hypothetical protein ACFL20_06770 [Spirochaetota bacterium]